jgi:monofunctional biosynthetic peptidoglycan transglycosylase
MSRVTSRLKRVLRAAAWLTLGFVIATSLLVAALRFIDPRSGGIVMYRQWQAWRSNQAFAAKRCWRDLDSMGSAMPLAVIAAEDQRFPEHFGLDLTELSRTLDQQGLGGRGASTISQQTAKNLFLWPARSFVRKGFELYFTLQIEWWWNKRRILEVYLNTIEFGTGVFGACAAAQHYFNTDVAQLSVTQAARLAAVLPNPHTMSVKSPSAQQLKRERWIVLHMRKLGGAAFLKQLE